jgi:hypothetical protein
VVRVKRRTGGNLLLPVIKPCAILIVVGLLMAGCTASPSTDDANAANLPSASVDPDSPYATTFEEFMLRTKACVEDKGFSVDLDPNDYSLLFTFGDQREQELVMAAVRECQAAIDPARLEPIPPRSVEQLRAWYTYVVAQVDCLAAKGYSVPSPPPEAVFIDSQGGWDPYYELLQAGTPATPADRRVCEQVDGRPAFLDW